MKKSNKKNESRAIISLLSGNSLRDNYEPVKSISIDELIKSEPDIDFAPPYQRKVVWEKSNQTVVIYEILSQMPINTIHLVKERTGNGGEKLIVLDGKQRLTAIFKFIKDSDFKIDVELNKKIVPVSYQDLRAMEDNPNHENNAAARKILRDFRGYKIDVVYWKNLSLAQQSAVFEAINFGVPLTSDEKLLSKYFYCKDVASFLMEGFFEPLSNKSRAKNDKRSKNFMWILRLLYTLLDDNCKGVVNPKNFVRKNRDFETFLKTLHNKVESYLDITRNSGLGLYNSDEEMTKMFEHSNFSWLDNFKNYSKFIEDIATIADDKISDWIINYFTLFILEKFDKKKLSHSAFNSNLNNFKKMFVNYVSWTDETTDPLSDITTDPITGKDVSDKTRRDMSDRTRRMKNPAWYVMHMNKLQHLYQTLLIDPGFIKDDNSKGNNLPSELKKLGMEFFKDNGNICPVCLKDVDETDTQDDHFNPKSLYSDPGYAVVMCKNCNQKKSNNDQQSIQKLDEFLKTYPEKYSEWFNQKYKKSA